MSVSYSTNWMGPVSKQWYKDRGLTIGICEKLEEDRVLFPKGYEAGDWWEYDQITTNYCAGRIDIRDSSKNGYDGWDEYSLAPMHCEDWNALSDFLWDLHGETVIPYDSLIMLFEAWYGKKIRWWIDEE